MSDQRTAAARRAAELIDAGLPAPPDGMDARVLAALAAEPAPKARVRWRLPRFVLRPALVLGAAAVVLLLAALPNSLDRTDTARAVVIGPLPGGCPAPRHDAALEVAGVWDGAEARSFARVLAEFSRQTGVKVVYHYETRDMPRKLRRRVANGCPPDVALLPQPGLLAEFARQGAIVPLDANTAGAVRASYSASWQRLGRVDGRAYGVWFKASDKSLLWYRPAALRAAGIAHAPATWAQLRATTHRLATTFARPLAIAGAEGWTLTDWFENLYLQGEGAARYDALARHELPWTDPSVRRTLARLAALLADSRSVGDRTALLRTSFEASVRDALGPRATSALVYEGDFVPSFLDGPATGVAMAPFPTLRASSGRSVVVGGDVAASFSKRADAARLMRFLATPRAAERWARHGGFTSPNRNVHAAAYPDALTRSAAQGLAAARTVRFDLSDLQPPAFGATIGRGMWDLFRVLAAHPDSVDAIARRLEAAAP